MSRWAVPKANRIAVRSTEVFRMKRREIMHGLLASTAALDRYSTGVLFDGWTVVFTVPPDYEPLPVHPASSWMLTDGWRIHGPISPTEVPGGQRR